MKLDLLKEIKAVIPDLNQEWKEKYALFLADEHLALFSENLLFLNKQKTEIERKPYFKDEIVATLQDKMVYFKALLESFENESDQLRFNLIRMFEETPFEILLLILGQRLTSASRRDETGIPPLRTTLIKSCFEPYNKDISVAVRAWEKHAGRNTKSILGEIKGNREQKRQSAQKLIDFILDNKTWWNVFYHYKHDLVYEARIENGQGLRWSADGKQFIGFLEDFLEE